MSLNGFGVNRRELLLVLALFCASRLCYALLGVYFDTSTVPHYMQFIDQQLLATRLIESLWYYHANPPLLNLLVGAGYKLFGNAADVFFVAIFHLLGIAITLSVYVLTLKLANSRVAARIVVGVLVFSPSFVLYENWLMYTFPSTALLTMSAVALYKYADTRKAGWGIAFFGLLAALLLTRSLFHLAWLVLVVMLLACVMRGQRRQVLLVAFAPVLIVALWYGKNWYYFGSFSGSTWMGLGLANISTLLVPKEELQPLVDDGRLSRFAVISRYRQMDQLFEAQQSPPTGIPVLDQVTKANGAYNFNNRQLIEVNRQYAHDALTVIKTYPFSYVLGLVISNRLFFSPTNMNVYFSEENRKAVQPMERVFNPLLYGVGTISGSVRQPHFGFKDDYFLEVNTSIPLIVAWIVMLGFGYVQTRGAILADDARALPRAVVIGFIVVTALYLYAVGTALELAENYRYRFMIEPLFFVLSATAITALIRRLRGGSALRAAQIESSHTLQVTAIVAPLTARERSIRIAFAAASVMAFPGLIALAPYLERFVHAMWSEGISLAAADRDFANYWLGARMVLSGEYQDLFVYEKYFAHMQAQFGSDAPFRNWGYPPHVLLLLWPLGLLGYKAAMAVFLLSTAALFFAAAIVARRTFAPTSDWRVLAVAVAAYSVMMIHITQNGFLTGALLLFGLVWMKQRPWLAGAAFALLTVKPQLGLLIPLLLILHRQWRTLSAATIATVVLVGVSVACFGIDSWTTYLSETLTYQRSVMTEWVGVFLRMMPTVFGGARLLGVDTDVAFTAQWVTTALAGLLVIMALKLETDRLRIVYVILCGTFLVSPYAFDYDMGALTVAAALLVGAQSLRWWAALAVGLVAGLSPSVMWLGMLGLPIAPLLLFVSLAAVVLDSRLKDATYAPPTTDSSRTSVLSRNPASG